jgi:hypothetical protein
MMDTILTVTGVTSILVILISLLFQYFPGLRVKWGGVNSEVKMLSILAAYILIGAFVAFGGCIAFIKNLIPSLMCSDVPTFFQYVTAVIIAVGGGQGVFKLLPEMQDVSYARAIRQ